VRAYGIASFAVLAGVAGSVACSSSYGANADDTDQPDAEGGADDVTAPPSDAGPFDGPAGGDAESDAETASGPPSLLRNGSFEEPPGSACLPGWTIVAGVADRVPSAKSGTWSCRICTTGVANVILFQRMPAKSGSYIAEAYAQRQSDGGAGSGFLSLRLFRAGGFTQEAFAQHSLFPGQWTRSQVVIPNADSDEIEAAVYAKDGCVLFDDVTLTYSP
jgi:hypothetical protein